MIYSVIKLRIWLCVCTFRPIQVHAENPTDEITYLKKALEMAKESKKVQPDMYCL